MNQPKPRCNNSFIKQCAMVFHLYLLDSKEIKPVNPKGNQSWIFIGRTDAEAEAPILWPPGAKSQLIGKDPDAGKDWGQEEMGVTEDEMVGMAWPTQCTWVEQTLGHSEGQGSLVCCSPWGCKVRHDWATKQQPPPYIVGLLRTKSLNTFLIRNFYVYHGAASSITCQKWESDQIRSVAQSCPTLCDPMNRSTPGLPVHHQLPEFTETHVHRVSWQAKPVTQLPNKKTLPQFVARDWWAEEYLAIVYTPYAQSPKRLLRVSLGLCW